MAHAKLGQHFLIKGSILERIAAAVCPQREELVVEIGPGRGALTGKLLERAARVVAIELDSFLAAHLRAKFAEEPRLEVRQGDILDAHPALWGVAPVAGNLPYYITSPIIEKVVRSAAVRSVFLIQKEVADRLVSPPGERGYGYLTVSTAVFARARKLFEVKPSAFHPPPKVDSAVVLLERREEGPLIADAGGFLKFAGLCFHQKRKTLRNNLAEAYGAQVDAWPEAKLRAEQIPMEGFLEMYQRVSARPLGD